MSARWVWPALLAALVAATLALTPRPLDVRVTLEREGDRPFDAEVFHALLPGLSGHPVENVAVTPYERLADTTLVGTVYVLLTRRYAPEAAETDRLLAYAARGNTVVVAASILDGPLAHALGTPDSSADGRHGLRTDLADERPHVLRGRVDQGDSLWSVAPGLERRFAFPVAVYSAWLEGIDSTRTAIRMVKGGPAEERRWAVAATVGWGRGRFVVSSSPLAFSNAALTGEGDAAAFVGALWADVPRGPVLWDDSAKPFGAHAQTPLRFVLATPALRTAYALLVLAGLLYLAFRGRRWQRPIPVVAPPPNAQREFARTVGRLHLVSGDTQALARRKARTLLDRAERELRLPAPDLSDATARRLAARAGVPEADALSVFARLRALSDAPSRRDPALLVALDRDLDALFAAASRS